MNIMFEVKTDIGQKRRVNEDNLWPKTNHHDYQPDNPYGMLFIVADGIGGHGAGNVASGLAVDEIAKHYYSLENEYTDIGERLRVAIQVAHQKIRERAAESPDTQNMGTTVVAIVVRYEKTTRQGEAWVAWAGDSRLYLLRRGRLKQVTRDHSRIWPLIEAGELNWDEQRFHPDRSKVVNALAARQPHVTPEEEQIELEPGDQLLLCSDGLSGEIRPETIEQVLVNYPLSQAAELLIQKANGPKEVYKEGRPYTLEGGNDNITALIIQIPADKNQTITRSPSTLVASPPARSKKSPWPGLALAGFLVLLMLGGAGLVLVNSGLNEPQPIVGTPSTSPSLPATVTPTPKNSVIIAVEEATATPVPLTFPSPEKVAIAVDGTRAPTVTRETTATHTPPPTATPLPSSSPATTTPPPPSSVITMTTPILLLPDADATGQKPWDASQEISFMWQWPGELTEDLSFEVMVWLRDREPVGAHNALLLRQQSSFERLDNNTYTVNLVLKGARGVSISSSDYLWSVALVRISPEYEWLGIQAEPRPISLMIP